MRSGVAVSLYYTTQAFLPTLYTQASLIMAAKRVAMTAQSSLSFTSRSCCKYSHLPLPVLHKLTYHFRPHIRPAIPHYHPNTLTLLSRLLLNPPNPRLAGPQSRRILQIAQRPPSRSHRRQHTRHNPRLGRLRHPPERPRPPHFRAAAQDRRRDHQEAPARHEVPPVPPHIRQHRRVHFGKRPAYG